MACVRDNLDLMQRNGFDIREAEAGTLHLTAVPFSRGTTFGAGDVAELAQLLLQGTTAPGAAAQASLARTSMLTSQTLRPSRCSLAVTPSLRQPKAA